MKKRPISPRALTGTALYWSLIFSICLSGFQHLYSQTERSNSFIEVGGFFVDAFAAGQGGQSSEFRIKDEVQGALISGRAFQGFFNPAQWNSSFPFYLQYSKLLKAYEAKTPTIGIRLGLSRLDTYGPQAINPINLSLIQLRYSKPILGVKRFKTNLELGFGLAGLTQNSSAIASAGISTSLDLSKALSLKLASEFTNGLNQNFFDFLVYTASFSYRLRPSKLAKEEAESYADRDLDGVSDERDRCPDDFGYGANLGCPDQDNDGVVDLDDACPLVAGPAENMGCPIEDADGDSVADAIDQCPDLKGSITNNGCPEPLVAQLNIDFNQRAKRLPFSKGEGDFQTAVDQQLEAIIRSMKKKVLEQYLLLGFTDASGPAALNQRLSEQRAKAFYDYLVSRGIDAQRLRYEGRGELPEDPSLEGVEPHPHRRVEIHLVPKE